MVAEPHTLYTLGLVPVAAFGDAMEQLKVKLAIYKVPQAEAQQGMQVDIAMEVGRVVGGVRT